MRIFGVTAISRSIFLSFLALAAISTVYGAQSDLDPTFGNAGKVIWSPNNNTTSRMGSAMALQADGKIVMAGGFTETFGGTEFMVVRFHANGSLDTTFGTAGVVTVSFGGTSESAVSVDIQSDGKIVVGGQTTLPSVDKEAAIARLNTDGSLDTTFSGDGKTTVGFTINGNSTTDYLSILRVMPTGKIVFAGTTGPGANTLYYRNIGRLNTDGSPDASFGTSGLIIEGLGTGSWHDVVGNADGTMFAGGAASAQFTSSVSVRKFSETGATLWDWVQVIQFGCSMGLHDLAALPDGKVIAAGSHNCGASVRRINADGSLDTTFSPAVLPNSYTATAVAIQPDGKVITAFGYLPDNYDGFSLARFNTNGSLDPTFGTGGVQRIQVLDIFGIAGDIVIQPDGKFVLGGRVSTSTNSGYRFALVRYKGLSVPAAPPVFDYDGDGRSDVSVFRPSENKWYIFRSSDGGVTQPVFALSADVPTPADFDGDGKTDVAIFRPSSGDWWYLSSVNGAPRALHWGQAGDVPLPSDFDGDGRADFIVYRPSDNMWYRFGSSGTTSLLTFGIAGDKPLVGDFDGDGKADPAVFRPSTGTWWYAASGANDQHRAVLWGLADDVPVPSDYDGDGKDDFALFRPSDRVWYIVNSSNGSFTFMQWGLSTDRPVAADYDGDGKADIAVFRPSTGIWYLMRSTAGFGAMHFGISTDTPTPSAFIP